MSTARKPRKLREYDYDTCTAYLRDTPNGTRHAFAPAMVLERLTNERAAIEIGKREAAKATDSGEKAA